MGTGLGLPSPRPFHDCIAGFAPRDCRCLVAGPGCCLKRPPAPRRWPRRLPLLVCPWKQADLPSSRRNPCRCAHAPSTPEDPGTARPYRCAGHGHGDGNVHGFFERLSRLNRMALRLAVYASHRHVAVRHARLASGCVAALCRVGLAPTGSHKERFQLRERVTYHSPFASLLGAIPFPVFAFLVPFLRSWTARRC